LVPFFEASEELAEGVEKGNPRSGESAGKRKRWEMGSLRRRRKAGESRYPKPLGEGVDLIYFFHCVFRPFRPKSAPRGAEILSTTLRFPYDSGWGRPLTPKGESGSASLFGQL